MEFLIGRDFFNTAYEYEIKESKYCPHERLHPLPRRRTFEVASRMRGRCHSGKA